MCIKVLLDSSNNAQRGDKTTPNYFYVPKFCNMLYNIYRTSSHLSDPTDFGATATVKKKRPFWSATPGWPSRATGSAATAAGAACALRLCASASAPLGQVRAEVPLPHFPSQHGARRIFAIQVTLPQPSSLSLSPLSLCLLLLLLHNANDSMIVR
jgi:hypothetical protein